MMEGTLRKYYDLWLWHTQGCVIFLPENRPQRVSDDRIPDAVFLCPYEKKGCGKGLIICGFHGKEKTREKTEERYLRLYGVEEMFLQKGREADMP